MHGTDETTGLPTLPDGYFWRVHRTDKPVMAGWLSMYPCVVICQRKKARFGRGKVIETEFGYNVTEAEMAASSETVPEVIYKLAYKAAKDFYRWRKTQLLPDYCGDYPPRVLP